MQRWLFGVALLLTHAAAASELPVAAATSSNFVPLTCRVQTARGTTLVLRHELKAFKGYQQICEQLAAFVDLPAAPLTDDVAREASHALTSLGTLARAACSVESPDTLACAVMPAQLVRSVHVRGHLPLALLRSDLTRRIFLRPGTRLDDQEQPLVRQEERLRDYLRSEGYFDAAVAITSVPEDGAEPAQGQRLEVAVSARQSARVRHVTLTGDIVLPTEKLAKPFLQRGPLGLPFRFRPLQLPEDTQKVAELMRHHGYIGAHVRARYTHHPEAHAVDIVAEVSAGRRVAIDVVGNKALSRRKILKRAPFYKAQAVDAVSVGEFRDSVVRLYQERGFADVQVTSSIGRAHDDVTQVTLSIVEGEVSHLEAVVFQGLHQNPEPLMAQAGALENTKSTWRKRPVVDAWVAHDVVNLRGALINAGMGDAQLDVRREPGKTPGGVRLIYSVAPQAQLVVHKVRLLGLPRSLVLSPPELKLQPGAPYRPQALEDDIQELETALSREGYLGASVRAHIAPSSPESHALTVTFEATPGRAAKLGGIFIRGAFRTRRQTLIQELKLKVGRPLDLPALGAARRRLRNLNLFNAVQVTPAYPRPNAERAHLVLAVEERDVRSLDGVIGFASDFRFGVGGDFRDANFLGRAINLTLSVRLSDAQHYLGHHLRIGDQDLAQARLDAPRPFGLPLSFTAQLLYRYQDPAAYREQRLGGQVSVQRPLLPQGLCPKCPDMTVQLGYELLLAYRFDKTALGMLEDYEQGNRTIARLVPVLSLDARDNPIDPHRGIAAELRLEGAHPALAGVLGERATSFWRLMVGMQGYIPLGTPVSIPLNEERTLGGPWVLALAFNYAAAGPYGPRGGVPPSETFGYGGDLSVRGLVNRASTEQLDNPPYMITASAELRIYALANLGIGSLQVAGFCDVGTVAAHYATLFDQSTISAGPALRYVTPVGPLSVAYGRALVLPRALRLAPNDAPPKGRVHITFGYTF